MWDRIVLKEKGKQAFRRNYWHCVLVAFILVLFVGGNTGAARMSQTDTTYHNADIELLSPHHYSPTNRPVIDSVRNMLSQWFDESSFSPVVFLFGSAIALVILLISIVLNIFVFSPLEVGGCRFFIENAYEQATPGRLLFPFNCGHYGKIVAAMFLKGLYIFAWGLLLVIPGIIKSYEYRMVPYLMAECPEMGTSEAFRISKELMYGQKLDAFVLDLSFIGWSLLSACTCGILGIFYVSPYQHATNAELFLELKRQYFAAQNQNNDGMQ